MGAPRLDGPPRHARPLALASAVVTLLGALSLCLGLLADPVAGAPHGTGHDRRTAARTVARTAPQPPAPPPVTRPATPVAAVHTVRPVPWAVRGEAYGCPYEPGGCSLFPALSPAVLGAPPLDPPPHARSGLPQLAPPHPTGRAPLADARPRAPDLHVLQVLRT